MAAQRLERIGGDVILSSTRQTWSSARIRRSVELRIAPAPAQRHDEYLHELNERVPLTVVRPRRQNIVLAFLAVGGTR
jgi:hypothetical protein